MGVMAKITELPVEERPREKALLYGIDSLSNSELLSIILSYGVKNYPVMEVSNSLLSYFGGIENLQYATLSDLLLIKGINKAKALILLASFELNKRSNVFVNRKKVDLGYLVNFFKEFYRKEKQEKGFIVLLNSNDKLLFIKELFSGNENSLSFSAKKVISSIIQYDAKKYYLIHNHPSGNPNPSEDDRMTTSSIELITFGLSCQLVDHIIFGNESYYLINKNKKFNY